jgi:Flp pilus assembly protein TadG
MQHRNLIRRRKRRGVQLVECALVYPLVFLVFFGIFTVGMGVFRYQQVASLARDGARWASVRGWQSQNDLNPYNLPGLPRAATAQDVRDYVVSMSVGLDQSPAALDVQVRWNPDNKQTHILRDNYGNPQVDGNGSVIRVSNTVTVTVAYQWTPEVLFAGPITLKSTSTVPMSY